MSPLAQVTEVDQGGGVGEEEMEGQWGVPERLEGGVSDVRMRMRRRSMGIMGMYVRDGGYGPAALDGGTADATTW